MKSVIYTAAHGGFELDRVPLGGAAAVCHALLREWDQAKPFDVQLLSPRILGAHAPRDKELVQISELKYARFCRAFERKTTQFISAVDPRTTIVLSNDVSEGPDFHQLAARGFSIYTIFHVDVVEYFTRMYLYDWIKPETATRFYEGIHKTPLRLLFPDVLGLVFQKQRDCVLYSKGLIVPSTAMREVLMRCYPQINSSKIYALPWGMWNESESGPAVERELENLRHEFQTPSGAAVLLTLSRISPEKGQDRLLRALALWEKRDDFPSQGLWVFIAGEAAYMQGRRFERKLRQLAAGLKRTHVIFPGYATGARKQALFRMADLYVFPSRHESYGLTLLEAMRAGLPVLACQDHGSQDVMRPEVGELLPDAVEKEIPELMRQALQRLLSDRSRLKVMGHAAKAYAEKQNFSDTAMRLAKLLVSE